MVSALEGFHCSYGVMYDEIYGVIYEITMRASMEPFWGLKIGKYVDYLTHVSSEYMYMYIKSWELLSPITTGQTSWVLLADVIPWINKASLVCNAMNQPDIQSYTVLSSLSLVIEASKLVTIEVESRSRTPWGTGINVACRSRLCTHTHYVDDLYHIITMQLLGMWSSFHCSSIILLYSYYGKWTLDGWYM